MTPGNESPRQTELEEIYHYAPVGLCLIDRDLRYVRVNDRLAELNGVSAENHTGKSIFEIVPELAPSLEPYLRKVMEQGQPILNIEIHGARPSAPGIGRDWLINYIPIRSVDGKVSGVVGAILDVTARKRMERDLEEREKELQEAQRIAKVGSWRLDPITNTVRCSEELCRILGLTPTRNPIAFSKYTETFPADARSELESCIEHTLKTGEPYDIEVPVIHPDGRKRWVYDRGFADRTTSGKIIGLHGTLQDVTERKWIEDALREREERFRQLAESINEVFWLTDRVSEQVLYVSPAFERIWGIPASRLYEDPMTWTQVIVPGDRDAVEQAFLEAAKTGGYEKTYRIKRPDGKFRWIHDRGFLIYDENKKPVRMAGVANDITDLKHNEDILKRQAEELKIYSDEIRDLYNNAPCGYHSLDSEGLIVQINDTELRWLGYEREEIVGKKSFQELLTQESQLLFSKSFPEFKKLGYVSDLKFELIRKDGTHFPILLNATAIKDSNGKYLMSRSTAFDYSVQKRLEEDLQNALKIRDEFLSIASHDLRTPLSALGLQIQILRRATEKGLPLETTEPMYDKIHGQLERLGNLVDDLLDLTRIRVGKLRLEPKEMNLTEAVHDTVSHFLVDAERKGSRVSIHEHGAVFGFWDPNRLDQVITNLVSNAIKYGDGKPIDIEVDQDRRRGIAVLQIKDRGIGIAPDMQKKIFNRFERAAEGEKIKGLGLGLYITRQIVENHRGTIRVESELGRGSTFIVELPLHALQMQAA